MLIASIFAHVTLGLFSSLFFVLYYIKGDDKWKIFIEFFIGIGGNASIILLLSNAFEISDTIAQLYSIGACFLSFFISTIAFLIFFSFNMRDKNDKDLIQIRDILLGMHSYITKYYESKAKEIDEKLNLADLKLRETQISEKEHKLSEAEKYLEEELLKLDTLKNKKLKILLPENTSITITKEYIDIMPSYFKDIINCISQLNYYESEILKYTEIGLPKFKAYLLSVATTISSYIFNNNSTDIRIHFRFYNKSKKGYEQLIAIIGKKILEREMTFIPYNQENMISKSFECKRALIRSINYTYDYRSQNYKVWKDYLTYTFHDLEIDNVPILSFGISIKNDIRYKNLFYFLNYIKFEEYLQENIDNINNNFKIKKILYGG